MRVSRDNSLSGAGEFGMIARITARMPQGETSLLGPGDDAAVVSAPDGRVVACTDAMVEGRHFRRDWCEAADIGHRAAAANLADVAAMGATPTALLVALCAPPDTPLDWAEELAEGLAEEAALVGASVVGGDTTSSPLLMISVTALGDLAGRAPVTRSGAQAGDTIALAGRLGFAAAGYTVLSRGFRTPKLLVDAYRRPVVPYPAGPLAAVAGATSMIDVSDGLLGDLGHIAAASNVRLDVHRDAFDVPGQMRDAAMALGCDVHHWILAGGDDHAFAATFPASVELPIGWTAIGRVHPAVGTPEVTVDGRTWKGPVGWDHFTKDHNSRYPHAS
ncbi:thiamine-monophosphate kinase [Allocatelliglobosispora scoriae]|uniref:Thiamine-monophosphate kinase n=1 Tax=Allocatelliglobosispora scoriae TaxID=643052 RepID=A0A841BSY3_9ACTN|nr:thiamine-phosphate kinase [Allocatelliglobosispora scoriae]MBB5872187.1 thiamine-monophosphate kinase [Allocatelliglobosispora scoriae]